MIDKPDSVVSFMISEITTMFPSMVVSMIRRDTKFLKLCELSWFKTTIFHLKPINPPLEVCYLGPQLVRILSGIAKALHVLPNENGPLTRLIQKPCPTYSAEQTKSHVLRKKQFPQLIIGQVTASGTNEVIK